MGWNVTPISALDLSAYNVTPFGETGNAQPFVRSFIASGALMSDALTLDASATASLKRALCIVAGVTPNEKIVQRDEVKKGKKTGKKIDAVQKTYNASHVRDACATLNVAMRALASAGDGTREHIVLVRTDADGITS